MTKQILENAAAIIMIISAIRIVYLKDLIDNNREDPKIDLIAAVIVILLLSIFAFLPVYARM